MTDMLTEIHGRRFGLSAKDELVVDGQVIASRALVAQVSRLPIIALIGDSRAQNSGNAAIAAGDQFSPLGPFTWAMSQLAGRCLYQPQNNFGIGGTLLNSIGTSGTPATTIYQQIPAALATGASYILIYGGVNDVTNGRTLAQMMADTVLICNAIIAGGAVPVLHTEVPVNFFTAPQRTVRDGYNNWLRAYNNANPAVILVDDFNLLVDPATGTNEYPIGGNGSSAPATAYTYDGLHFAPNGAIVRGTKQVAVLGQYLPPAAWAGMGAPGDAYDAVSNPRGNLLVNGQLTGTTGALRDLTNSAASSATGVAATSWRVYRDQNANLAVVGAKGTATINGVANQVIQNISVTTSSGGNTGVASAHLQVQANITTGVNPGDVIDWGIWVNVNSATGLYGIQVQLQEYDLVGVSVTQTQLVSGHGYYSSAGSYWGMPNESGWRYYPCPQITVNTGLDHLMATVNLFCDTSNINASVDFALATMNKHLPITN